MVQTLCCYRVVFSYSYSSPCTCYMSYDTIYILSSAAGYVKNRRSKSEWQIRHWGQCLNTPSTLCCGNDSRQLVNQTETYCFWTKPYHNAFSFKSVHVWLVHKRCNKWYIRLFHISYASILLYRQHLTLSDFYLSPRLSEDQKEALCTIISACVKNKIGIC